MSRKDVLLRRTNILKKKYLFTGLETDCKPVWLPVDQICLLKHPNRRRKCLNRQHNAHNVSKNNNTDIKAFMKSTPSNNAHLAFKIRSQSPKEIQFLLKNVHHSCEAKKCFRVFWSYFKHWNILLDVIVSFVVVFRTSVEYH